MANIPASAKRKAVEKVKKTLAKEGIKLKDIKLAKGKAPKKPPHGSYPGLSACPG